MHPDDEKLLNTFQLLLVIVLLMAAITKCSGEYKQTNIESCKPIGCMELNNVPQHQATEQR
jgi:hypothetical protein